MKPVECKDGNKWCAHCKSEKPLNDFHASKRERSGRVAYCKPCVAKRVKRYFPEIVRQRRIRKANAVLVFGNKCANCGLMDLPIDAFVFHHKNGQKFGSIGYRQPGLVLNLRRSEAIVRSEMKKWAMLCTNCHNAMHGVGLTASEVLEQYHF